MNISIFGCGAVGTVICHRLAPYVSKVHVLVRKPTIGLTYRCNGHLHHISNVISYTDIDRMPLTDINFLTVKQYDVKSIINQIDANATLVVVQNGLRDWSERPNVVQGLCYTGAFHNGTLVEFDDLASFKMDRPIHPDIDPHLGMHVEDDFETHQYRKLIVNSVINPITTICGMTNGELYESLSSASLNPSDPSVKSSCEMNGKLLQSLEPSVQSMCATRPFVQTMLDEASLILGVTVTLEEIRDVLAATRNNRSSMYQDSLRRYRTEYEWICAPFVDSEIPTPAYAFVSKQLLSMLTIHGRPT